VAAFDCPLTVGAISSANCWVSNSAIDQPTPQPNMTMAAALITVLVAVMRFMAVFPKASHTPTKNNPLNWFRGRMDIH
jgi:hypothetical protein